MATIESDDTTYEESRSESQASSASHSTGASTETRDGSKFYDFRCIHDGLRVNGEVNYNKVGIPLPKSPTIVPETDSTGCEILGDEEGGVAYCRCTTGQLSTAKVPKEALPELGHGTDDIEALVELCRDAIRMECGVEPVDPDLGDGTGEQEESSSSGDGSSSDESSSQSSSQACSGDSTQGNSFPGDSTTAMADASSAPVETDQAKNRDRERIASLPDWPGCSIRGGSAPGLLGAIFALLLLGYNKGGRARVGPRVIS